MHHFKGPPRQSGFTPISGRPDYPPTVISPDPSQAVPSHPNTTPKPPSSTPKIPSQSQASTSRNQPQSSDPPTITFEKPAKAASVDWSTITIAQGRSPHPRFGGDVDSQLREDSIRGWSRDVREPEFRGFHTSYEDLVNAVNGARGGKETESG